jgi:uncharacterized membrane protein
MSPGRLETFADGVFAIAATLLILDVHAANPLSHSLTANWPSYVAYAVSFITIGIIWMNHHAIFSQVRYVDRMFLLLNVLFLMLVAFIPFPTSLIASHLRSVGPHSGLMEAALTYGATLTITAIFFNALWFYASLGGGRLLRPDADARVVRGISRSYIPGPFIYLISTLVALGSPNASVILYAVIAVFYIFENSVFGRSPTIRKSRRRPGGGEEPS